MINRLPREEEWVSWSFVGAWAVLILLAIPMQQFIYEQGRVWMFGLFSVMAVFTTTIVILRYLFYYAPTSPSVYAWLLLVTIILIIMSSILRNAPPEEVFHVMQYFILGFLMFRALRHRMRDVSIYFAAILMCSIISIVDHATQWSSAAEYAGIELTWWNIFAASLAQLTIAKGLRPRLKSGSPNRRNSRRLGKLLAAAFILTGIGTLSFPARQAWYADRYPLELLKSKQSAIFDYTTSAMNYGFNEQQIFLSLALIVLGVGLAYRIFSQRGKTEQARHVPDL